jgi:hypothetical protein
MFGDIIGKLKLAQQDTKNRLEQILLDGQADNGRVKVVVNANKVVKQISISQELFDEGDKEAVEELLQVALNKAIEKAEVVYTEEMKDVAKGVMPNIPGLNF